MDSGFHRDQTLSFGPKRHTISFQSSGEMIMNNMLSGNSGMVNSGLSRHGQIGNLGASGVSNSVPGLKHDASLAVEWSGEEQCKLEEGFSIYADEPNIMKYIKIAATLPDKTVRDVALRCRWMMVSLLLIFLDIFLALLFAINIMFKIYGRAKEGSKTSSSAGGC
ncbi:uncharacterized protein LOC143623567 [Bidens hawaiensis]|uniref:uncharacterized protein LOC143623567 n=1 Tax=Bidens hawaiensis TaxID=980011 RepID=UPI0040493F77